MQYHIIWQRAESIEQRTISEWAWTQEWLGYPPKEGESYTIFPCKNIGCRDARRHARMWENVFQARISSEAERRRKK